MAHWAEVNPDNVVVRVLVTSNDEPDEGHSWLLQNLGGRWVKTSYNTHRGVHVNGGTPLRYNSAAIGYTYSDDPMWAAQDGAFIPPQSFPSWVLDPNTATWEAPVPYPTDGPTYIWDEDSLSWVNPTA